MFPKSYAELWVDREEDIRLSLNLPDWEEEKSFWVFRDYILGRGPQENTKLSIILNQAVQAKRESAMSEKRLHISSRPQKLLRGGKILQRQSSLHSTSKDNTKKDYDWANQTSLLYKNYFLCKGIKTLKREENFKEQLLAILTDRRNTLSTLKKLMPVNIYHWYFLRMACVWRSFLMWDLCIVPLSTEDTMM